MEIISRAVHKLTKTTLGTDGYLEIQLEIKYLVGERTLTLIICRDILSKIDNMVTYYPPIEIKGLIMGEYEERKINNDDVVTTIKRDTVDMTDLVSIHLCFGHIDKDWKKVKFYEKTP